MRSSSACAHLFFAALLLLAPAPASAGCPEGSCEGGGASMSTVALPDRTAEVRKLLDGQVAAWNRGDLEGYMDAYWRSIRLTFFAGGTVTNGWQPTLERYRRRYQGQGKEMGKLVFSEVQIDLLGADAALARGRWRLTFAAGKPSQGLFTVMLRKLPEGWRVVHDHSSSE